MKTNHVKRALHEGRPTAGAWLHLCSGISAEIMSRAGFDWLLVVPERGQALTSIHSAVAACVNCREVKA